MCKPVLKKGKYRATITPRGHLHCALAQFHAINDAPAALIRQSKLKKIELNLGTSGLW
jgi:hypothetical protein